MADIQDGVRPGVMQSKMLAIEHGGRAGIFKIQDRGLPRWWTSKMAAVQNCAQPVI